MVTPPTFPSRVLSVAAQALLVAGGAVFGWGAHAHVAGGDLDTFAVVDESVHGPGTINFYELRHTMGVDRLEWVTWTPRTLDRVTDGREPNAGEPDAGEPDAGEPVGDGVSAPAPQGSVTAIIVGVGERCIHVLTPAGEGDPAGRATSTGRYDDPEERELTVTGTDGVRRTFVVRGCELAQPARR